MCPVFTDVLQCNGGMKDTSCVLNDILYTKHYIFYFILRKVVLSKMKHFILAESGFPDKGKWSQLHTVIQHKSIFTSYF